jgi:hypothetical protein
MRLTQIEAGRIRLGCRGRLVRGKHFNPDEEHMGSTPYGDADPMTLFGSALPQDIEIDRTGDGRVRMGDRT